MKRQFNEFLNDILKEINLIKKFIKNLTFEDFKKDEKTIYAVTRSFEIIGEASFHIPEKLKNKYKYVPWQDIKDFRNVISHKYWGVELEIEWDIIQNELGILEKQIEEIIKKESI